MAKYTYRDIEQEPIIKGDGYIITLRYTPYRIARLFGAKVCDKKFYGTASTAWHDMSSWKICSRRLERIVQQFYMKNQRLAQRQSD